MYYNILRPVKILLFALQRSYKCVNKATDRLFAHHSVPAIYFKWAILNQKNDKKNHYKLTLHCFLIILWFCFNKSLL